MSNFQKRLVIGLVGEKLSGKGTVASYLAKKYNASVYRMSGVLDDILERLHLPLMRKNEIDIALALREKFGEDILAQTLKRDIESDPSSLIVIDGIRMPQEVEIFKRLPGFVLVSVRAPLKVRFQRMKSRQEKLDEQGMDFAQFKEIEEKQITETSISKIGRKAEMKIKNNSSLAHLYVQVDKLFSSKFLILNS